RERAVAQPNLAARTRRKVQDVLAAVELEEPMPDRCGRAGEEDVVLVARADEDVPRGVLVQLVLDDVSLQDGQTHDVRGWSRQARRPWCAGPRARTGIERGWPLSISTLDPKPQSTNRHSVLLFPEQGARTCERSRVSPSLGTCERACIRGAVAARCS